MTYQSLPIRDLQPRTDARLVRPDRVKELQKSIAQLGLDNPIRVRKRDFYYEVIAGVHRLEACKALGWTEVPCNVVEDDDLQAELAMIDENVCRDGYGPADLAMKMKRRKQIYEELNPNAKAGAIRARAANAAMGHNVSANLATTFTEDTAAKAGLSQRTIQRLAQRGENLNPDAVDLLRDSRLDTGDFLDTLVGIDFDEQPEFVRSVLEGYEPPRRMNPILKAYMAASPLDREEFIAQLDQLP